MANVIAGIFVVLLYAGFLGIFIWMWCRIMRKTGYSPWLGVLMLVPLVNLVMLAILAFKEWPIHQAVQNNPNVKIPKPLSAGATVGIIIAAVIPLMLMLAAIALPNFLRARLTANNQQAMVNLRLIAKAADTWASTHNGAYPLDEYTLISSVPPLLSQAFNNKQVQGYEYSLRFDGDGYQLTATPVQCSVTGSSVLILGTNGEIVSKECR